eukprot:10196122-Lingulodinium_polyedra.AAC.1
MLPKKRAPKPGAGGTTSVTVGPARHTRGGVTVGLADATGRAPPGLAPSPSSSLERRSENGGQQ